MTIRMLQGLERPAINKNRYHLSGPQGEASWLLQTISPTIWMARNVRMAQLATDAGAITQSPAVG